MTEKWEDVRVSVIRPGPTDPDGPCANAIPQDDDKTVSLQPGKIIVCLLKKKLIKSIASLSKDLLHLY